MKLSNSIPLRSLSAAAVLLILGAAAIRVYAQSVSPPTGMVAWWDADASSGTTATDILGGNHGSLVGGASISAGHVGQAFSFDGWNGYIEVPDAPSLRISDAVTIEFWARRTRFENDFIVNKGNEWFEQGCNYGVGFFFPEYNNMFYFTFNGGYRGTSGVSDTEWHHYAVVAHDGDANPALYIDGQVRPIEFGEGSAVIDLFPSILPLHIGALRDDNNFVPGANVIDELSIYHGALSAAQIQSIYDAGSAGKTKTPAPSSYQIAPLYDQSKAHRSGSTLPIKLEVQDGNTGANLSSSSLRVHAVSVFRVSGAAPGPLEDSGNANPDCDFRFDPDLGAGGGYIFNLSLKGFSTGTYDLNFTIGSDPTQHVVQFQVK